MIHTYKSYITLFFCLSILSGCTPIIRTHGHFIEQEEIVKIQPGIQTRSEVEGLLGSPSSTSLYDKEVWFYIGRKTSEVAFLEPKLLDQQTLAITFDPDGRVEAVKLLTKEAAQLISPITKKTLTPDQDMSPFEQVFGSFKQHSRKEAQK